MSEDVWKYGSKKLEEDDVRQTRVNAYERKHRKRTMYKLIMKALSERQGAKFEEKEEVDVEMPAWTERMMELYPSLYE